MRTHKGLKRYPFAWSRVDGQKIHSSIIHSLFVVKLNILDKYLVKVPVRGEAVLPR
jgi:hypothetical protein